MARIYNFFHTGSIYGMPIVSPLMLGDNEAFTIARMETSLRAVGAWTS
jgi:hypothetical protein